MDELEVDYRLAAYCVVRDDEGRVLLARWNEVAEPLWAVPGGGVELEEDFPEAAVREVREETGYRVELVRLLGAAAVYIPGEDRVDPLRHGVPGKAARVVYEARVVGGELTAEVGGSTDEARWFAPAEVGALPRVALVDTALRLAGIEVGGGPDDVRPRGV